MSKFKTKFNYLNVIRKDNPTNEFEMKKPKPTQKKKAQEE